MKSPSRPTFFYSAYWISALMVCLLIGLTEQMALGQAAATPPATKVLQMPGSNPNLPKYKPNEILVRFRKGVGQAAIAAGHGKVGGQVIRTYRSVEGLQHVRIPSNMKVEEAIRRYRQNPEVLYAEPNYRRQAVAIPNDTYFSDLWGMDNTGQSGGVPDADIDGPEAWDLSTGSSSVIVTVIDTGIDYNHEDLAANVFNNPNDCDGDGVDDDGNGWVDDCHGIDTINWDSDPYDDNAHGTHVSGTIGGVGNNGVGVAGVNWNVSIMACKFLDAGGGGWTDGAIACLDYIAWMKDNGHNIVATNNSWGGGGFDQALLDAILANGQRGILFFAAAGNFTNDNDVWPFYPANYYAPNLLSIAATNRYDSITSFSHWGRRTVHVGAPGEEILSTTPGNTYSWFAGTSMATPHVTGLAGLLSAQDPARDWRAIKNLILAGGDDNASLANTVTGKRLNAYGAMTCSNSTVFSRLRPIGSSTGTGVGAPLDLSALNINCAAPNGDVPVTVDPGGSTVTLLDDGAGTDLAAGDGIYSGQWTPGAPGTYTLTFPGGDVVTVTVLASYLYSPAPYNYRTIAGTSLEFGDDSSAMITPPFPIQFGGGSFNDVFVGSNGVISFSNYFYEYWNQPLPTGWTETLVAPFWDDLQAFPGSAQNAFWEVIGTEPNRELVIEWRDISHCCGDPSSTVKFQVVFFEGRSDIVFNYADVYFGGSYPWADQGASATVGVQVGSGVATQYSYESPSLSDGFALRWSMSQVALEPSAVDFGDLPVGTPGSRDITLTNHSAAPVNLGVIDITPADFTLTGNTCVSPIAPGGTCTFTVTFTASVLGRQNGQLTVNHDAAGSPSYAFLTGRGVSNGLPGFDVPELNFGDVELGSTSAPQTVLLSNTGTGPLGIIGVETTGDFAVHHNSCPPSLNPGDPPCEIGVAFTPLRLGLRTGELRVHHDGAGSPATVNLTGIGTPPPDGTYVYTNNDPWDPPNTVSGFLVAPDGALIEIPGSPFQTGGTGGGGGYFATNRAAISSVGNFLYVSNAGSGDLSGFAIDPLNGNLTPVPGSPFFAGGGSPWYGTSVAATADGRFVIAVNADAMVIYVYAKADDGSLVPAPGSPLYPDSPPAGIKVSPDGRFLALALPQYGVGAVAMYAIGTDGSLSPVPGSPFPDGGPNGFATGVDIDCGSRFAFVGEATYPGTIVDVFSIGPDGTLTPIPGSPFAPPGAGDNSNVPLLSPGDTVLFVSNQASNTVTSLTVAPDGSLTLVPGSPFPVGGAAFFTSGMATDQAGRFLFAANFENWVGAFSIGEGGVLTPVPGSPFSTGQPAGLLSLTAFPAKACGLVTNPVSVDFGSQRVATSSERTVTVANPSSIAFNISSIDVTGEYSLGAHNCPVSPDPFAPGATCDLPVTFTPTVRGLREGDVTIISDAPNSPQRVHLQGTGVAPEIDLSVSSLAFGEQAIGTVSPTQVVEMESAGDFVLNINSISPPSGDFRLVTTCGSSLEVGDHCNLSIDFAPTTAGALTGEVVISSDDPIRPSLGIALSGTGIGPVASISPSSLTFADQAVGSTSTPQDVTIDNTGNTPLAITTISISADYAQTSTCGTSLLPDDPPCTISVTFTPTGTGTVNGTLIIVHDASDGLNVISLTGNGVGAFAQLSASDLSFASQVVTSTSATQAVTLANTGNQAMTITVITPSTGFTVAAPTCPPSLAAGANCTLNVAFAPVATGDQPGQVTISSNAYPGTHTIRLSGTGTAVDIVVPPGNPTSITVNAGQAADFNLSLGPLSGFTGTVALSCTETIPEGSCSVTPASATLDGVTSVNVTVRATTTARSTAAPNQPPLRPLPPLAHLVGLLWLLSMAVFATLAATRRNARRPARLALGTTLLLIALWAACGGGGAPPPPPGGTPAGTYTVTVTATVGNFTDGTTVNLTVN